MPAPELEGRLLCACNAAFDTPDGAISLPLDPKDVFIEGAGFVDSPAVIQGGPKEIDACLVGTTVDGVVVAIRGTLPFDIHEIPNLLDWLNDLRGNLVKDAAFPGSIHDGFLSAAKTLIPSILPEVDKRRTGALAGRPVVIAGYSKGGPVASLVAWTIATTKDIPVKVVTFASAKVGDATFRAPYEAKIDQTRYEYNNDIVPHLPPSFDGLLNVLASVPVLGPSFAVFSRFAYEPVGSLKFIDAAHQIQGDSAALRASRDLALAELIVRGKFVQIFADHAIACGSGYMSGVAPTGVCP
jgi:hypothetical protein